MKQLSLFLVISIFLIGCGEKIYSVEEFMNDRQLICKYLQKCSDEQKYIGLKIVKIFQRLYFTLTQNYFQILMMNS